jgi:hypothetical protein
VASEKNLTITRGDSHKLTVTILDDETGLPIPLSGAIVSYTLYRGIQFIQMYTASAGVLDVDAGIVQVIFQKEETLALKAGEYYSYRLRVSDAEGEASTVLKGRLFIEN